MQLLTIVTMILVVMGVVFALQNTLPVAVSFLIWKFEGSMALVLLVTLALGGVIVALVSTPGTLRRQWTIVRLKKRIDELEKASREHEAAEAKPAAPISSLPTGTAALLTGSGENDSAPVVGLTRIVVGRSDEPTS